MIGSYSALVGEQAVGMGMLMRCLSRIIFAAVAVGSHAAWASQAELPPPPAEVRYVCVSLRALAARVQQSLAQRRDLERKYEQLGGISQINGYITVNEPGDRDVILVGQALPGRPTLHLDDLIVNMRCVGEPGSYPYCSLDPLPENIRALSALLGQRHGSQGDDSDILEQVRKVVGPQQTVVGGVPRDSRHAHIMIDADYHMKKVSQGHIQVPNVISSLDYSLEQDKRYILNGQMVPDSQVSMSRFWFHVRDGQPTFQEADGIVWLDDCEVVVFVAKQSATTSGVLFDVEEHDPVATAFADNLSREFSKLTASVESYADLENLFRLHALLLAMRHHGSLAVMRTDFGSYLPQYRYRSETPMEPCLPGLANQKQWRHEVQIGNTIHTYYLSPLVCGGVSMDMAIETATFRDYRRSRLSRFRTKALLARPSEDEPVWEVRASADLVMRWPRPYLPYLGEFLTPARLIRQPSEFRPSMTKVTEDGGLSDVVASFVSSTSYRGRPGTAGFDLFASPTEGGFGTDLVN